MRKFVTTKTIHRATVEWWWTEHKLHDKDYHFQVDDVIMPLVREAEGRYGVVYNTTICFNWEGICFEGDNSESVMDAALLIAERLSSFNDLYLLESK